MSPPPRLEELADLPDHSEELAGLVGQISGKPNLSWDAVNVPMIRHWVEAMGDENPVYLSDEAAQAAGYDELIAPPSMLQAWIMRGLKVSNDIEAARAAGASQGNGPNERMMALLDDEGLTSVVATNCDQTLCAAVGGGGPGAGAVGDLVDQRSQANGPGHRALCHDAA